MKYRIPLAALGLALGIAATAAPRQAAAPGNLEIEDADTLLVEIAGVRHRIQLPGIDAPESGMNPKLQRDMQRTGLADTALLPLGDAAIDALRELLPAYRPYRLVFDPQHKDRYGRTPGDLIDANGKPLSLRLVQQGYAVPVGPGMQDPALTEAAATARRAMRGLWHSHPETVRAWAAPAR